MKKTNKIDTVNIAILIFASIAIACGFTLLGAWLATDRDIFVNWTDVEYTYRFWFRHSWYCVTDARDYMAHFTAIGWVTFIAYCAFTVLAITTEIAKDKLRKALTK